MALLSVNAGSSSLKVAVFDDNQLEVPRTSVSIEGIGTPKACLIPEGVYKSDNTRFLSIETPEAAAILVKEWLETEALSDQDTINGIGYRVVHGGSRFEAATPIDDEVINYLTRLTPLAPNHMPATLACIAAFQQTFPDAHHIACFDTSFFHDVPAVAKTLPIPIELQQDENIRRYGFHGLSYQSLLDSFTAHEGETAAHGRIIMAHLGSGASVAACKNGKPIDMSMGFTPISGIMMSTRTGDLEPGVLTYLQQEKGYSVEQITDLVTRKSGLLGVSGLSGDMHTLLQAQHENANAKLAIDLFCYKIKKTFGAYAAALGGVDSIIFTGGIGERSAEIRAAICSELEFLGIYISEERNNESARLISSDQSQVGVHVIAAQEDVSIIKQTKTILAGA